MTVVTRSIALALVVAGLALLAPPSRAQQGIDPARLAAAKEMMRIARVERQFEQMMPLLLGRMRESFRNLAPDRRTVIDNVFEQMEKRFVSRRSELLDEIALIYAQKLELEEINAVVAFYNSPAGSKFIDAQPGIMQESMAAGQRWGQRIGREIEDEARRELKRRGVDL